MQIFHKVGEKEEHSPSPDNCNSSTVIVAPGLQTQMDRQQNGSDLVIDTGYARGDGAPSTEVVVSISGVLQSYRLVQVMTSQ